MPERVLVVSPANPYPVVTNGCARLVSEYQRAMFPGRDVWLLVAHSNDWEPVALVGNGRPVEGEIREAVLADDFALVLFIGFKATAFTRELARRWPSFCFTDRVPHPDVPDELFRGILSHGGVIDGRDDVLLIGGSYDDDVFFPNRREEDIVVCVGRMHPDKNQLELVTHYRETVFEQFGLPLHLVGGIDDRDYYQAVAEYVDGESVVATGEWRPAPAIAAVCNCARLFVSASPRESFGMALVEAMACGTTCVVNGKFPGFVEADLAAHVYGNVAGKCGSVVDLVAAALRDDVRIDASQWVRQYSVSSTRSVVDSFIGERLQL